VIEAEVADFWGHNVVRWNGAALRRAGVSDADASFLDRVGMPRNVNWTLDFASAAQEVRTLPGHASMVVIGGDDQNPICLRVSDGNVVCVEEDGLERFMNSTIFALADFLCAYQVYRAQVGDLEDDAIDELIAATESKMRITDAAALSNEENYWSVVLEQMEEGLL
jgi:hypothetical protein